VTLVAAMQIMGIYCPLELDIEEDEINNHELSLGARFLMGMVFGNSLLSLSSGNQFWRCRSVLRTWTRIVVEVVFPTQL